MSEKVYKRVKTPTVLQMEVVECGSACLTMILAYYGKIIPLERMRIECGVTRDGVKAGNIVRAGERLGLVSKAFRKEPNDLRHMKPPMIIHWNFNHFVVLEGFKRDRVFLNDPAMGHVTVSCEEFDKAFTGVVLTFTPKEGFQKSGENPSTVRLLRQRLSGSKGVVVFLGITGILLTIPGILIPYFAEVFVDDILMGGKSSWLLPLLCAMAITMLVQTCLMALQKEHLLKLKTKLSIEGSSRFFLHLLRLPSMFFQQRSSGDLVSRMNSNSTVATFLTDRLAENVINVVTLVFYFVIMLNYSVPLSMVVLALSLVNVVCFLYASDRVKELTNKSMNDEGKLYSTMVSSLNTIETIKAIGGESDTFTRLSGYHAKVLSNHQNIDKNKQLLYSAPNLTKALASVVVIVIGSIKVIQGDNNMTMGSLVAFQTLVVNFMQPISSLTQMGVEVKNFQADMNRINDVTKYQTTSDFPDYEREVTDYECRLLDGNIELRDVSFGYNLLEVPLVDGFSLNVHSGERVAIVGSSGSGKSTLLKILNGINTKWSGDILFDGTREENVSSFTRTNSISCVEQKVSIFSGTIYDNITMWNPMVSEKDVIRATKDAMIYDEISKRPLGFKDSMSTGGRNFSGGQCQRIEIARALAINPSIILMDEATSALDPNTEKAVLDNIRRRGCTCIMVAHRLSTIRDCDKIIVMEHGHIVQQGTHEELKSVEGVYSNLINTH